MRATIEPRFLTVDETAEALNASRTRVYHLLVTDELRSVKEGRRRLIDPRSIDDYRARRLEQTGGRFRA